MTRDSRPQEVSSRSSIEDIFEGLRRASAGAVAGVLLALLTSAPALAGGGDVSTDEIYSDGVTLTEDDPDNTNNPVPLDVNDDGETDLAIASNRNGVEASRYYPGNGDGTFGTPVLLAAGASSEIAGVDINNDTFLDLIQVRRDDTTVLHLGDGAGGLAAGVNMSADTDRSLAIAVGDLDGDGDLDIVLGNGRPGGVLANPPGENRFYLNDLIPGGTLSFTGADIAIDQDDSRGIALADMDNDGDLDVIAGNDETTAGSNRIYLNQFVVGVTPVSFDAGTDFGPPDDQTAAVLVGDLNLDGLPDIVTVNNWQAGTSPGINRFFLNTNTVAGTLSIDGGTAVSADGDKSSGGMLADFDGDGDLDLAVANSLPQDVSNSPRNRLYLNQFIESGATAVTFSAGTDISTDEHQSRELAAADINNDGNLDIVVGNQDNIAGVRDRRYLNNGTAAPFTNVAPVIDSQANTLTTNEETDLTIVLADVTVTDADNVFPDDFTLTVQAGTGYTLSGNTITPDAGFSGDLTVPVIVNDGENDSPSFNLTVTVNDTINNAPTFASTPVLGATQDAVYTYNVTATDLDVGAMLAITAPTLPAWLSLTDNGDGTATLTGTPAESDIGDNDVSLQVSDGTATANQDFTITVANVNDAPAFTSTPVTDATEDVAYTYNVTATDADVGDVLAITAPTLPGWLTLTDNGDGTATLTGTPGDADTGDNDVSLQVSDGTASVTQDFTIAVASVDNAPSFTSTPVTDATVGAVYTYNVTTEDLDSPTLTITAPTLPAWLTLTDNGDGTAVLTGTPTAGDLGGNDVSLQVDDGSAMVSQDFTITVFGAGTGGNSIPAFTSTPVTDATSGTAYTYDVTASDPDAGDTLAITAPTLPTWLTLTDNGDGTATLTGTPSDGDVGDNDVVLRVSDGTDDSDQAFTIAVVVGTAGNNAPSFTSTPVTDANEGNLYTYNVTATDPDSGDTLEITGPTLPSWLRLTDNGDGTATLTGTPQSAQVGEHAVSLQVSDGTDTAVQDFTITVGGPTVFPPPSYGDNGGGSFGLLSLGVLGLVALARRRYRGR